jgi:uncharacterized protein
MRRFDLRSLRFDETSEAWRRLPVEVAPFVFGGLEYLVGDGVVEVSLTAAKVGENITLVCEIETTLLGPCQRCLEDAGVQLTARGVEYVRHGDSEIEDEEEETGYVAAYSLDIERWVRDLIAEALPDKLLCQEECRGLCPLCGANLNQDLGHRHEAAD